MIGASAVTTKMLKVVVLICVPSLTVQETVYVPGTVGAVQATDLPEVLESDPPVILHEYVMDFPVEEDASQDKVAVIPTTTGEGETVIFMVGGKAPQPLITMAMPDMATSVSSAKTIFFKLNAPYN